MISPDDISIEIISGDPIVFHGYFHDKEFIFRFKNNTWGLSIRDKETEKGSDQEDYKERFDIKDQLYGTRDIYDVSIEEARDLLMRSIEFFIDTRNLIRGDKR